MTITTGPSRSALPSREVPISPPDAAARRTRPVLVFAGLLIAMLAASLDQTVFSTALPTIVGDLRGVQDMLWVTTAYILASTVVMPVYGKVGDLVGRKGLFITAIALFMAGSVIGALAQSMPVLILGRAVEGLGGGGLLLLAQAIIADVIPARQRGKYTGVMGGVFAVSSIAGPLLGGYFAQGIGWRWAFWINLPIGAAAIAMAVAFLHLPRPAAARLQLDYRGMALLAVATVGIVLTSTWGGSRYAWTSPLILTMIAASVVAAVLFVAVERHAAEAVMPMALFRDRNFDVVTAAGLITGVAMFGAVGYLPTYIQMVTGYSATVAGLLLIPMMAAMLVASTVSGLVVTRTGRYKVFPIAGTAVVALGLLLLSTLSVDTPTWVLGSYLAVLGLGLGMGMQIFVLIVQNAFPARMVGTATAANTYFRQVGASLGSAVVGSLFTSRLVSGLAGSHVSVASLTPVRVDALPAAARHLVVVAYNSALTPIFGYLVPMALLATVLLVFVYPKPLATTIEREPAAEPA